MSKVRHLRPLSGLLSGWARRLKLALQIPYSADARWRSAMLGRRLMLALGLVALVGHEIAPDMFRLDTAAVTLFVILILLVLAPSVKELTFPGGGGFKWEERVKGVAALQDEAHRYTDLRLAHDRLYEQFVARPSSTVSGQALTNVRDIVPVDPQEGIIRLRAELGASLRRLFEQYVGLDVPASDFEVVRGLAAAGVIDLNHARVAYAVIQATSEGARLRDVPPVAAAVELVEVADRLLSDVQLEAVQPERALEKEVEARLRQLAPEAKPFRSDSSRYVDFQVGKAVIEVKYVRRTANVRGLIGGTVKRLNQIFADTGRPVILVINDDAPEIPTLDTGIVRVRRLSELTARDLAPSTRSDPQ
jgi:hypothetical protein